MVNEAIKTINDAHTQAKNNGSSLLETISSSRKAAENKINTLHQNALKEICETHTDKIKKLNNTGDERIESLGKAANDACTQIAKCHDSALERIDLEGDTGENHLSEIHAEIKVSLSNIETKHKKTMAEDYSQISSQMKHDHLSVLSDLNDERKKLL